MICLIQSGTSNGVRTRVAALKGQCPSPLDDEGMIFNKFFEESNYWRDSNPLLSPFGAPFPIGPTVTQEMRDITVKRPRSARAVCFYTNLLVVAEIPRTGNYHYYSVSRRVTNVRMFPESS